MSLKTNFNKGDRVYAIGINPTYLMDIARKQISNPSELMDAFAGVSNQETPKLKESLMALIEKSEDTSVVEIIDSKVVQEIIVKTNGNTFIDALNKMPGYTAQRIGRGKLQAYIDDIQELDKKFEMIDRFASQGGAQKIDPFRNRF